jgi:Cu(I)-responsive transcriptional regulator
VLDLPTVARFMMGLMKVSSNLKALAAARERGYYTIGQAADLTGVTAKMIRHYESLGLLTRVHRTAGDYRVYSDADLHTLRFIKRARNLGFSMKEIDGLLSLWRNQRRASAEVKRLALKHVAELDEKIEELKAMRRTLSSLAEHCHGDERPECPILEDLASVSQAK